ncbi:MAG TPA: cation diffusion facilitator family transporter [Candidatus Paceibacterota bacterium]
MPITKKDSHKVSGYRPVLIAIAGDFFVTVIKFIGFLLSGSGVLFSETVHSLADTLNQIFLMIGIKRSVQKENKKFSYGYGKERFFWALISACGIFFIGAVASIYKGVLSLIHEEQILVSPIIFAILFISLIVEFSTLYVAFKDLKKHNKGVTLLESLKYGDPATITVVYEDAIAVLGVVIAFGSILLYELTGNFYWDAIGSIVIGIMLGIVAVILISKNHGFLVEKSIPKDFRKKIVKLLEAEPSVEKVIDFKSSVLDINKYRIKCEIELNGSALMRKWAKKGLLKEEYENIKDDYEEFLKFCVDYMDRAPRLIGTEIDQLEQMIRENFPEVAHIDIEIN